MHSLIGTRSCSENLHVGGGPVLEVIAGAGHFSSSKVLCLTKFSHDSKAMVDIGGPHDSTELLCISDEGTVVSSKRTEEWGLYSNERRCCQVFEQLLNAHEGRHTRTGVQ